MNYQVSLKEKRILSIAEGLTAMGFKASSLLCDFSWSSLWFFSLWCWIKISMNWYSGTSSCAFAERVGLIYSLINNTAGGKPREVRAFSSSTCLRLWVSLTVGKHSSGLCWTAGCHTQINYRVQERLEIFSYIQSGWGHLELGERALGTKSEPWHFSQNKACSVLFTGILFPTAEKKEIFPSQTQSQTPIFYLVTRLYNQYRDV